MAEEKIVVYQCPCCPAPVWFNGVHEMSFHLYKEHMREMLDRLVKQNMVTVKKSHLKWMVK
jgi:hypothetical protein